MRDPRKKLKKIEPCPTDPEELIKRPECLLKVLEQGRHPFDPFVPTPARPVSPVAPEPFDPDPIKPPIIPHPSDFSHIDDTGQISNLTKIFRDRDAKARRMNTRGRDVMDTKTIRGMLREDEGVQLDAQLNRMLELAKRPIQELSSLVAGKGTDVQGVRPEDEPYAIASHIAYESLNQNQNWGEVQRELDSYIGGYTIDREISTERGTLITDPQGNAILAFRGTDPKELLDLTADVGIILGTQARRQILAPARFREADRQLTRAIAKYGIDNLTLTGHSLGGTLADSLAGVRGIPAVTFNQGESPAGIFFNRLFGSERRDPNQRTRMYIVPDDPVSMSNRLNTGRADVLIMPPPRSSNPLSAHSLSENFLPDKLPDRTGGAGTGIELTPPPRPPADPPPPSTPQRGYDIEDFPYASVLDDDPFVDRQIFSPASNVPLIGDRGTGRFTRFLRLPAVRDVEAEIRRFSQMTTAIDDVMLTSMQINKMLEEIHDDFKVSGRDALTGRLIVRKTPLTSRQREDIVKQTFRFIRDYFGDVNITEDIIRRELNDVDARKQARYQAQRQRDLQRIKDAGVRVLREGGGVETDLTEEEMRKVELLIERGVNNIIVKKANKKGKGGRVYKAPIAEAATELQEVPTIRARRAATAPPRSTAGAGSSTDPLPVEEGGRRSVAELRSLFESRAEQARQEQQREAALRDLQRLYQQNLEELRAGGQRAADVRARATGVPSGDTALARAAVAAEETRFAPIPPSDQPPPSPPPSPPPAEEEERERLTDFSLTRGDELDSVAAINRTRQGNNLQQLNDTEMQSILDELITLKARELNKSTGELTDAEMDSIVRRAVEIVLTFDPRANIPARDRVFLAKLLKTKTRNAVQRIRQNLQFTQQTDVDFDALDDLFTSQRTTPAGATARAPPPDLTPPTDIRQQGRSLADALTQSATATGGIRGIELGELPTTNPTASGSSIPLEEQTEPLLGDPATIAERQFTNAMDQRGGVSLTDGRVQRVGFQGSTAGGVSGGVGVLAGYGISELTGGMNPYGQAALAGATGDVAGRIAGRATEMAIARSAAEVTELGAAGLTRELLMGASEGAILSAALLPVDIELHRALSNKIHDPVMAGVADSLIMGGGITAATAFISYALAPETFGATLALGTVATAASALISVFEGDKEKKAQDKAYREYEEALQQQAEAERQVEIIKNHHIARRDFMRQMAADGYDFDTTLNRYKEQGIANLLGDPDSTDYQSWERQIRAAFGDGGATIPQPSQHGRNLSTATPASQETPEEARINNLYARYTQNQLIDRVCQEVEQCTPDLNSHRQQALTEEELNELHEATAGLYRSAVQQQVEIMYQEFEYNLQVRQEAQQEILDLWNTEAVDIYQNPDADDLILIKNANMDGTFTEQMQNYIRDDAQREIMAAYYHDLTTMDDMDEAIVAAAERYDAGYINAMNQFYDNMETQSASLGLTVEQFMALQAIDHEELYPPDRVFQGRRDAAQLEGQLRAEKQMKLYREFLNENVTDRPELLLNMEQARQGSVNTAGQPANVHDQAAIDAYNANLREQLYTMQSDYFQSVVDLNNQLLRAGRTDLLYYQTADLYNQYRLDATNLSDGSVILPSDTGGTVDTTAVQEEVTNTPSNPVSYTDIYNYMTTIDGYDQMTPQAQRDMFDYYANNLNALPEYITEGKDIPLDQQKGRLAPVERQVAGQELTPTPVRQEVEPAVIDKTAPPPTRERPIEPPPQLAPN